jgi:molybdopterin/thiamine biosynthesis adenylyltransferase
MTLGALGRFARLEVTPGIGLDGIASLRSRKVAVVGVGNIGGQLAQHLVLLGMHVVLVDCDVVEEANLGTQGFAENQIGQPKVDARTERLGPLNSQCRIEPIHADIRQVGLGALREASLLFSCLDSRPARSRVNEMAVRLGIPWVDGALDGSGAALFGRVACYDPRAEDAACYLCPYDAVSLREMWNDAGSPEGCAARWSTSDRPSAPTLATSALGGVVASIQAVWGTHILLGRESDVAGREIYFDLGRSVMSGHRLVRNRKCLFDHRSWQLLPVGSGSVTVADVFGLAEERLGEQVVIGIHRSGIVTRARCEACGAERRPFRVADAMLGDARCVCGSRMRSVATEVLDRFGRSEADAFLDRTWSEIGIPPADVVTAASETDEIHFLLSD